VVNKILFVFIVALIIRISYAWFFVEESNLFLEDQMMYIQLAQHYPLTGFLGVTSERMPGYPFLVATIYNIFGESNMAVVMMQVLIDSLACVVIGLIAETVVYRSFIVAGIVSAVNLNMIILSGMVLTDTLFLFLFSLFILFAFRYLKHLTKIQLFLAVSFLCFATLVRPVSYYLLLLLFPLLIGFILWKKVSFKQAVYSLLLYMVPVVIAFGSLHLRNYDEYSSFSLTSQGGSHALHWVVPATYQYSGQGSYQEGQVFAKDHMEHAMSKDNLESLPDNPFKSSSYRMRVAKEALTDLGLLNILHAWSSAAVVNLLAPSIAHAPIVRSMEHPSFYATSGNGAIEKLLNYITNTDGLLYLLIIIIGTIISLVFLIISMFGFYRMIGLAWFEKKNREILLFSLFIIIYFIAITGPVIGVKYRLPIEIIMIVFFSYALGWIKKGKIKVQ